VILLAYAVAEELASWPDRAGIERLITGVGPVEAGCAIASALARKRYDLVVNAGIGGAFDGAARIGDGVVVGEDAIELDLEDGAPIELPRGERPIERARSDPNLAAGLRNQGFAVLNGITVSRVTATVATAGRLARRGAQVETMEGFAALRAAELAGVPAIELRGISNRCGDRDTNGWNFAAGATGLRRILDALLELR
jgi:futalosine hydrolase